jgi:hypothetical protein
MLDFVFSSTILGVPLKGRMLYYFPHILVEYNTWIYNLHIYISCDLCEKNAVYRGIQNQIVFPGLADGLLLVNSISYTYTCMIYNIHYSFRNKI